MKVGLFFGSFNPIHNGHLIIAEHIINYYTDFVWFVVSPQNPFKKFGLLNIKNRIVLTKAAINKNPKFKVSDIELNLPKPSYTIKTLKNFSTTYPKDKFFLIIGSDNFLNINTWMAVETIISQYQIIVYQRPGFLIDTKNLDSKTIITKAPLIDVSATQVRKLIKEKKSIKYLVPDNVISLIKKNNYYS